MQQVTEIYGGEGGWDSLAWHGFTTMSTSPDRRSSASGERALCLSPLACDGKISRQAEVDALDRRAVIRLPTAGRV